MKNLSALFIIILICTGLIFSGTITVKEPNGSEPLFRGKTYKISWIPSGCAETNYKINIFKNSISTANFKLQLTASGVTFKNWAIPANFEPGNYVIRVKAEDTCKGDSNVFEIKQMLLKLKFPKPDSKPTFKPPKGFMDPKITFVIDHPLGALKAGTRVVLKGRNFGQNKGKVMIKGNFPGGKFYLENVDWDSNTRVLGYVPQSVNGRPNQPVKIVLVTALKKKSNEWAAKFEGREIKFLTKNDVVLVKCGKDGNCNRCNHISQGCEGQTYTSPVNGFHRNTAGAIGDDEGEDVYSIKLYNGWEFKKLTKSVWFKSSGDEFLSGPFPIYPEGSSWQMSIYWKVTPGDYVSYAFEIEVEGPLGTNYK